MKFLNEIVAWPDEKKNAILERMNNLPERDIEKINQEIKEVENSEGELGILTSPHLSPDSYRKEISLYCYFLLDYDKK